MINELKKIGLADKEAKVYVAMLELGPATMLDIAAKAGVNRPTAYVQLEGLKKKGLASTQSREGLSSKGSGAKIKKQLFMAETPAQIYHLLDREKAEIEQHKEEMKTVMPDLMALFNMGDEKPAVRYFEGREGMLRVQEEYLQVKNKEILGIYSLDQLFNIFPGHLNTYTPRRVKKRIFSKVIYTTEKGPVLAKKDSQNLREAKFIAPSAMPFSSDITIFDNKVSISSLKGKPGTTVIQHSEVADSFRALFQLVWNSI